MLQRILVALTVALAAGLAGVAREGQQLQEFKGEWAVGGPYTKADLAGKVVLLYYFEEGCPSCRGRWPGLLELSKKFSDKPVLFLGVNSGNPKSVVQGYAKSVSADWAFLADPDRSFEKETLGMEISLRNIYQARILDAQGSLQVCDGTNTKDMQESLERFLSGAKWKVDPGEVPESLKKAWRAFEFGQLGEAAPLVRQALSGSDAKAKAAAQKMEVVIKEDIDGKLKEAKAKSEGGDKWGAYKLFQAVAVAYKDFSEAKPAAAEAGKLKGDGKVSKEIRAQALWEQIRPLLASPKKSVQQQGQQGLQALLSQYPETEAAAEAKALK